MKTTKEPVKKLKLSFAMGGGVSLGAFSGAALTEALKLLLISGLDDEGRRYTHIELDSMSGASAGAVSLCIMLSCLLNYKRYLSDSHPLPKNKFSLNDIDAELGQQFGVDWKRNYIAHVEPLRALQVAQKLQEVLWVERVNMDELVRLDRFNLDNKDSVSLLDRSLLIELVNEFILSDIQKLNTDNSHIISKERFLFACSLTNLIPLALGNGDNQQELTEPLVKELQKAHASYNHKELRLFDFQLNRAAVEEGSRLTKAITVGRNKSFQFQIDQPEIWSIISATCLACAAFPFAFEPVVLKRYKYEYKIKEYESGIENEVTFESDFETKLKAGDIPVFQSDYTTKYNKRIEQSVPWTTRKHKPILSEAPAELEDEEFFYFSYIDGGTLNNEPIREAFRMANYLDTRDPTPSEAYDRVIIFVDPIVRTEQVNHNSESFYSYNVKNKYGRLYVRKNGEWNRLTSYTSKLIDTLRDQGAIKEEHKISTYMSSVNLNKKLTLLIDSSPFPSEFTDDFTETILEFLRFQSQQNNDDQISTFDVNDRIFIEQSIKKYLIERKIEAQFDPVFKYFYKLIDILRAYEQAEATLSEMTAKLNHRIPFEYIPVIKKLFYHNILQAILDADGKDPNAMRMAITPVRYPVKPNDDLEEPETIKLPGSEFEAFGGFANHASRAFSNAYGRYCAFQALTRGDFRNYFTRIMNDGEVPYNARMVQLDESDRVEKYYRKSLMSHSPLAEPQRANLYWKDIRLKIYRLLKLRINKSFWPIIKSNSFISAVAALLIAIFLPWSIQSYLPFSAAIVQFLLFVGMVMGALHLLSKNQKAKLHQAFYYHRLDCIKLVMECHDDRNIITHVQFTPQGKKMPVLSIANGHVCAVPYFIGYLPFDKLSTSNIHFITEQHIKKRFNHVFSLIEKDIQTDQLITSIQFYKKSLLSSYKLLFEVPITALLEVDRIEEVEKFISPIVRCDVTAQGLVNFELLDEVQPLEDRILTHYEQAQRNSTT